MPHKALREKGVCECQCEPGQGAKQCLSGTEIEMTQVLCGERVGPEALELHRDEEGGTGFGSQVSEPR